MIGGKEFSILICFWRHAQKGDDSQWYFFPLRKSNVLMNLKEDTLTSCFSHWCHQLNCEYIHRLFIWYRYSSKGYNNSQALKMEENSIQVEILNVVAYERISCFRVFVRNLFCFWYLFYSFLYYEEDCFDIYPGWEFVFEKVILKNVFGGKKSINFLLRL